MLVDLWATVAGKVIAALAVIALALAVYIWFSWDDAEQPKQDARSSRAEAVTAREAAEAVIENAGAEADVDKLVEEAARKIQDAPTPEIAALEARSAICAFAQYRDKPECRS